MHTLDKNSKETALKTITNMGYKMYFNERDYPKDSTLICLFQTSRDSPWVYKNVQEEEEFNYYKTTSDIKNRTFFYKKRWKM